MTPSPNTFFTSGNLIAVGATRAVQWQALKRKDWDEIDQSLRRGDVTENILRFEDADGDTILTACIRKGHLDIFLDLIESGADVNFISRSGQHTLDTAMIYADDSDDDESEDDIDDGMYAPWTKRSSHFVLALLAAGADPRLCASWSQNGVGTYEDDCIADEVREWLEELRVVPNSNSVLINDGPGDLVRSFMYREETLRSAIAAAS